MDTENVIQQMEESVSKYKEQLEIMIKEMADICNNSQILCNKNPRKQDRATVLLNNPKSIHFSLGRRGRHVLVEYTNCINNHDLELQGMDSSTGSLWDRQERLRSHLILEWGVQAYKVLCGCL
ncbi:hypothetical protein ACA910_013717 [Epithemia clementina (nom. ined.)]